VGVFVLALMPLIIVWSGRDESQLGCLLILFRRKAEKGEKQNETGKNRVNFLVASIRVADTLVDRVAPS
jgi:hypothetical protein